MPKLPRPPSPPVPPAAAPPLPPAVPLPPKPPVALPPVPPAPLSPQRRVRTVTVTPVKVAEPALERPPPPHRRRLHRRLRRSPPMRFHQDHRSQADHPAVTALSIPTIVPGATVSTQMATFEANELGRMLVLGLLRGLESHGSTDGVVESPAEGLAADTAGGAHLPKAPPPGPPLPPMPGPPFPPWKLVARAAGSALAARVAEGGIGRDNQPCGIQQHSQPPPL